ncbi:dephospho-CoA kinase [Bifidobacterium miconisargentati]|uniref:dephospho-CoA kinase n=1 Tax=Bifidobacterium miconisargentati TaxID=2834437 RepID=UPI001BDD8740|nr:dephospho-CoA kinase [Bifidobacterium miconisargentati]MBW3089261.1 dephospho-CoA kinase [Bifidobacterium miconisargentati]
MALMLRIGLTGGIAAGKSTVAARWRELGAVHIDYDALARRVVEPGGEALPRIAEVFGEAALNPDGTLNRAWIADHIFGRGAEPGARERLDAIEHPLIYDEARWLEANAVAGAERSETDTPGPLIVVHDVPLLAEVINTIPFDFDHIVTVEAPVDVRVERMVTDRGMTREQARDRILHQSSEEDRRAIADVVIDATRPLPDMLAQADALYRVWALSMR